MTITEKIGQKIMMGIEGTTLSKADKEIIEKYKVANVILFRDAFVNRQQALDLCREIHETVHKVTGKPAFIAVDQEGGIVTRLPKDMANVPGAMALASGKNPENLVKTAAKITAKQLKGLGINFNLAPVLDTNTNASNPVIGVRSYGYSPEKVSQMALLAAKEYMNEGILCCGKHFPGHGDTHLDSHVTLPKVEKTLAELEKAELIPFAAAIKAGMSAIMTSHILFPAIEPQNLPATMSEAILHGLLRQKMGFDGIIITDAMEMNAIKDFYGITKGAIMAAKASADIICICRNRQAIIDGIEGLIEAAATGDIPMEVIDQSVNRILKAREAWAFKGSRQITDEEMEEYHAENRRLFQGTVIRIDQSVNDLPSLGDRPFFLDFRPYALTGAVNANEKADSFGGQMVHTFGGTAMEASSSPTEEEAASAIERAQEATSIVIASYNALRNKGQLDVIDRLVNAQKPVIVIAMGSPYDLHEIGGNAFKLAAFQHCSGTIDAVLGVLKGEITPPAFSINATPFAVRED